MNSYFTSMICLDRGVSIPHPHGIGLICSVIHMCLRVVVRDILVGVIVQRWWLIDLIEIASFVTSSVVCKGLDIIIVLDLLFLRPPCSRRLRSYGS